MARQKQKSKRWSNSGEEGADDRSSAQEKASEKKEKKSSSTGNISKTKRLSKRKSFIPKRISTVEEKKQSYQIKRFGNLEGVSRTTLREIVYLQGTTHHLIPRLPFSRLVRELFMKYDTNRSIRIQAVALEAIQEAAELFIVDLFIVSNMAASHAKRKTVQVNDMTLARALTSWRN